MPFDPISQDAKTTPSSRDGHDKPLNIAHDVWDLASAVNFIRALQPEAHSSGWNLCLGGGVLNNGFSTGDLDIVAVPRGVHLPQPPDTELLQWFPCHIGNPLVINNPTRVVYRIPSPMQGRPPIDLIIISPTT